MISDMKNSIVIPCYNEADRLDTNAFMNFAKNNPDYALCFVNDGSSDGTSYIISCMSKLVNNIFFVDLEENVGKAEAVRQGVHFLLQISSVKNVGFIDADLSTDFKDYTRLVNRLETGNESVVIGSRKMITDEIERNPIRLFLSAVVGFIIHFILGLPIKDTQCGAKVFDRRSAMISFNKGFLTRWLFDVEVFLRLKMYYGRSVIMNKLVEMPLNRWEDVDGSKLGFKDSLMIPLQLIKIAYSYAFMPQLTDFITVRRNFNMEQSQAA